MRILIFHGYLLAGTGSNVYNARLAETLVRLGHEVHLLSQDRHPQRQRFVDAAGEWRGGRLRVRRLRGREPVRCTLYRPDIGGLLPVYVADRYEGIEARTFAQCSDEEVARYIAANVGAVRELLARVRPQAALANHLVMGPVILARALRGQLPYAVKVHGSALEYTVKQQPERFLALAREGLADARAVLVGSRHTALSLWQALQDPALEQRTRLGPPGVDTARFAPRERPAAAAGVRALAGRLRALGEAGGRAQRSAFSRDTSAAARALEQLDPVREPLVAFVGKLIVSKGVDLMIAAWPLVLERVPGARLVVVGFGAYRGGVERLRAALAAGRFDEARRIATAGRALEGGGASAPPLRHLLAFLDSLQGEERARYARAARGLERVLFSGRLEHDELAELLPACDALAVPSTFPESFGMVAVEAAACGALPVSAAHSGLAEVSDALARALPERAIPLLTFALEEEPVRALADRLARWLASGADLRASTRAGLVAGARETWSWESVARGVIAACEGRLEALAPPRLPDRGAPDRRPGSSRLG